MQHHVLIIFPFGQSVVCTANNLRLSLCWCLQGTTALMYACKKGRPEAVKLVLDSGSDLAAADNEVALLTYAFFGFLDVRIKTDNNGIQWCNPCTPGL